MGKEILTEIVINASKEKVWNILTDFNNYKSWNPFIIDSSGTAIEGTRLINKMKTKSSQMKFKPVLITVRKNEYFDWLGSLLFRGLFDGHHFFKIDDLGNGQVKLTQGENFSGILSGIILKSIGVETKENFVKMNNALRNIAEKK